MTQYPGIPFGTGPSCHGFIPLSVCLAAVGDADDENADAVVVYLGNDPVVSYPVSPQVLVWRSLQRGPELARVIHVCQSVFQEIPQAPLNLRVESADGPSGATGIFNPPGHATCLPR